MMRFTSERERRLWIGTLILVVGIYATLGLAATLAGILPQEVVVVAFLTGMALVAVTVLTQGFQARPGGLEIGVALGMAAVYWMVTLRIALNERSHLIEYGVVAVFVFEALSERARQGGRVPLVPLLAIAITTIVGTVDELIQLLLPSRHFDPVDILFNFLAAAMAVVGMVALGWARRWSRRRRER